MAELGVDYLTLGGHKFYGPLGAAALWVRTGSASSTAYLVGGSQERRRRAWTENVPAIVGLGKALRSRAARAAAARARTSRALRDRFERGLCRLIPDAVVHCAGAPRLPQHLARGASSASTASRC